MLRDNHSPRDAALAWPGWLAVVSLLLAAGLVVSGLRGPVAEVALAQDQGRQKERDRAADKEDAAAATPHTERATAPIDLQYIPNNPFLVIAARPAQFLDQPSAQPLRDYLKNEFQAEKHFGMALEDIAEVKLVMSNSPTPRSGNTTDWFDRIILRATSDHDWKTFADFAVDKSQPATYRGKQYFRRTAGDSNIMAYFRPDARTIVLGSEEQVRKILAGEPEADEPWRADWKELATGDLAAMIDVDTVRQIIAAENARIQPGSGAAAFRAQFAVFQPILDETQTAVFGVSTAEPGPLNDTDRLFSLRVVAQTADSEGTKRVQETAQALVVVARNGLQLLEGHLKKAEDPTAALMQAPVEFAIELLSAAKVTAEDSAVRLAAMVRGDNVAKLAATMLPAIKAARASARRMQSMNNLKQIALAMHNYHDTHGHFPPPVVLGPDGKTPHSWRVAILPFLEQQALYERYRFDEPWDSEANKQVLEQMPQVYRHPMEMEQADWNLGSGQPPKFNSAYFVYAGEGAIFSGNEGAKMSTIHESTSGTILAVEAKRDIPWTKPEDLPFDKDDAIPTPGGYFSGGALTALADGSVKFMHEPYHHDVLRALITKAGGEDTGGVSIWGEPN